MEHQIAFQADQYPFIPYQKLLNMVREVCDQFQIASLYRQLEVCQSVLNQNQLIDVAILGQFKAGKSSFLNSLIGKPILPVGVIPVTTTITRLQYGPHEKAVVRHFNGKDVEIDLSEVESYTSETKNPNNQKNVELVDIELPSLKDYTGLRLVDTPGLGSTFKYHMEISENWLPEVGSALLAISADRPLGENDLELIRNLKRYTPKIIILLTKADLLNTDQQVEIIEFLKSALQREFHQEFPIYPFSTRKNTGGWKNQLTEEVFSKLTANREEEFITIRQHKFHSLGRSCLGYLEIALKTSAQADADREKLRKMVLDEKVNFEVIQREFSVIARENSAETRILIMKRLEDRQLSSLKRKMTKKLTEEMPSWKGNLWKLTRHYEKWIQESMLTEIKQISQMEHRHFFGTLKKAYTSLNRSLGAFKILLDQNVEKVLGLRLPETDWKIEVAEPNQPDIRISRIFDFHFDLLWFLIPMFIFRSMIERYYFNQISWQVTVNISRLAAQWEELINKVIDGMRKQALEYVKDELATIENLLSRVQGHTDKICRLTMEIKQVLGEIE